MELVRADFKVLNNSANCFTKFQKIQSFTENKYPTRGAVIRILSYSEKPCPTQCDYDMEMWGNQTIAAEILVRRKVP